MIECVTQNCHGSFAACRSLVTPVSRIEIVTLARFGTNRPPSSAPPCCRTLAVARPCRHPPLSFSLFYKTSKTARPQHKRVNSNKQHSPRRYSRPLPLSRHADRPATYRNMSPANPGFQPRLAVIRLLSPATTDIRRCHFRCFIKHRKRLAQTGNPTATYCTISPPTILRPLRPRHIPQRFCRSANPPRNRPALLSYACCPIGVAGHHPVVVCSAPPRLRRSIAPTNANPITSCMYRGTVCSENLFRTTASPRHCRPCDTESSPPSEK